ncbi:MAG: YibE/F family protein [Anaerovoracaceae bacterium]
MPELNKREKALRRNAAAYILVTVLSVLFIAVGANMQKAELLTSSDEFFRAEVIALEDVKVSEISLDNGASSVSNKNIYFKGEFKSGEHKGEQVTMLQHIDYMYSVQAKTVEKGDEIIVSYAADPVTSEECWMFIDYNKIGFILGLCAGFFVLILIIGRLKGAATIVSLVFTAASIFMVYIPSILAGRNIYLMTAVISVYIILMSLIFINGVNIKTFCAILGNVGGVAVAGLLAFVMNELMGITGVVDEDCLFLLYINSEHPIDLKAIVWGSIVIGSLGAVMDVAMSIASAMNELSENMGNKSRNRMIRSGMNIGKDAIGTMTNTLILAYIGGALATVLLLVASNRDPLSLFNMEMIVVEILQGIIGSTGILFAVPVTVVISAYLYNRNSVGRTETMRNADKNNG